MKVDPTPATDSRESVTAHALAEVLGQGQAHAGPLDAGLLEAEAVEGDEDAVEVLGPDASARVGHGQPEPAPGARVTGDVDPTAGLGCTSRRWTAS